MTTTYDTVMYEWQPEDFQLQAATLNEDLECRAHLPPDTDIEDFIPRYITRLTSRRTCRHSSL